MSDNIEDVLMQKPFDAVTNLDVLAACSEITRLRAEVETLNSAIR